MTSNTLKISVIAGLIMAGLGPVASPGFGTPCADCSGAGGYCCRSVDTLARHERHRCTQRRGGGQYQRFRDRQEFR